MHTLQRGSEDRNGLRRVAVAEYTRRVRRKLSAQGQEWGEKQEGAAGSSAASKVLPPMARSPTSGLGDAAFSISTDETPEVALGESAMSVANMSLSQSLGKMLEDEQKPIGEMGVDKDLKPAEVLKRKKFLRDELNDMIKKRSNRESCSAVSARLLKRAKDKQIENTNVDELTAAAAEFGSLLDALKQAKQQITETNVRDHRFAVNPSFLAPSGGTDPRN